MDRRDFVQAAIGVGLAGATASGQGFNLTGRMGKLRDLDRMPTYRQPDGISCGPTSVSMVLKYYGKDAGIGPLKTACGTRMYAGPNFGGKRIEVGLTVPAGVEAGLERYGVGASVRSKATLADVMGLIDKGRPPILLVRSGWDTWHWVVAVGYYDNGVRFLLHDPGSGRRDEVTAKDLQMGWDYSGTYGGKDLPNPRCDTCAGSGKVNAPNPNLQCVACSGSGKVKIKVGPFETGLGRCKLCGGSGRWKGKIPKVNCVICGGRGHLPEAGRSFVGTLAPRNSLVVPDLPAADRVVKIMYTIRNDSGRTVKFKMLPSGKSYSLEPRKTFSGTSSEVNGEPPRIIVEDTGRRYKMTAGNHKFWWIAKEKRVGFDRSTD